RSREDSGVRARRRPARANAASEPPCYAFLTPHVLFLPEAGGACRMTDLNPHVNQMADESMVRNLTAQIEAIWPQELPLYRRYGLADDIAILDAGCGTGEASVRLAALYPRARVLGVDILDQHLALARTRGSAVGSRLTFENRSIYELGLSERSYDLVTC